MSDFITLGIFLAGGLLGGACGFVMAKALRGGDTVSRRDLESVQAERQSLQARLEERTEKHDLDMQTRQEDMRGLEKKLAVLDAESRAERDKSIHLRAERDALDKRVAGHETHIAQLQEKMHLSFENLSRKIFDEKAASFKEQSKESMAQMLDPLKERLADFDKLVTESFGTQAQQHFHLKEEINRIVETHQNMTVTTESLSRALRGDNKVQGNWGEMVLEKILTESGLREGHEYTLQGAGLNMRDADTDRAQRPDVVVHLPDDKDVIIDAKVSLAHYERYCAEGDQDSRQALLKQYLASVRGHVTGLAERGYQNTDRLKTLEFVLMFMPIEGAFALALQQDGALQEFAWGKKIILVCPSTLFACLRTIQSMWRIETQNRNAEEIARKSGQLYDKIAGFIGDMEALGKQLSNAEKSFNAAMNKLYSGKGSMLSRAENIRSMGAKASKSIDSSYFTDDADETETGMSPALKIVSE